MSCTPEQLEYARQWYAKNKERLREKLRQSRRAYYEANKQLVIERAEQWRRANPAKYRASAARWERRNRDRLRARQRRLYATDPKYKVYNLENQARRRRALSKWADAEKVRAFYAEARRLTAETGVPHVVDHIIPIKHARVCGLHNEFNLRVITESENARKRNKWTPDA